MNNIWKRLFICLLVCVIIGVSVLAVCISAFHQSGIHFLGSAAHLDVYRKCYFIEDGSIAEESMFRAEGYAFGDDFSGILDVEGYSLTPFEVSEIGPAVGDRTLFSLTGHGIDLVTDTWNRYYTVIIPRKNPNIIVIQIWNRNGDTRIAVCADSEEEAVENYIEYREHLSK